MAWIHVCMKVSVAKMGPNRVRVHLISIKIWITICSTIYNLHMKNIYLASHWYLVLYKKMWSLLKFLMGQFLVLKNLYFKFVMWKKNGFANKCCVNLKSAHFLQSFHYLRRIMQIQNMIKNRLNPSSFLKTNWHSASSRISFARTKSHLKTIQLQNLNRWYVEQTSSFFLFIISPIHNHIFSVGACHKTGATSNRL